MRKLAEDQLASAGDEAPDSAPLLDLDSVAKRTTISIEEAATLLGIGRTAAYEAARRGQLPTRRLGRRIFVPVPALLAWLGVAPSGDAA